MVKIKLLREGAQLPTHGSEGAAGKDLYAAFEEDAIFIYPHTTTLVPTGISLEIPKGYWGGVFARSGLATKQGLRPANCVGVIDADYRGEVFVALHNDTDETRTVHSGDRIAQLIILPYHDYSWEVVDSLEETSRGSGGFGSTGSK